MDYEKQRAFLARQRRRLVPAAVGCALLLAETIRMPGPLGARTASAALALVLLWGAYYLPNYLGLDAAAIRRTRWFARARWFALLLALLVALGALAKIALAFIFGAAMLHLALAPLLRKPSPLDLREPQPARLAILAAAYSAGDFAVLWMCGQGGASVVLVVELLLVFAFLALVLLRPRSILGQIIFAAGVAALSVTLSRGAGAGSAVLPAAAFLWTAGTAHLLGCAVRQNLENFDELAANLQAFCGESRETVVRMMAESVPRLAEDWHRSRPQGQPELNAWYSRNARLYLYANCQHHLLYKHIVYALGLLKLARGRVLDFGGGPGNLSCALARAGVHTTYLDVPGESADYLRWRAARERIPVKIVHELDSLESPYDVVYALDVVEHLLDLKPVFARWKELLRPGGRLVATYYNGPNSTAPMHIDPGYDARDFLLGFGFRDVKPRFVSLFSPELMRKPHFMILEKE